MAAFFDAYTSAMEKYAFTPDRIYNLDETSLSTVMKPVKVVCERGSPVASQISRERGATMTFVGIINAAGHYLPPVFIIPRKRWNDSFMRGTLDGSKGILQASGWMNGECFLDTLKHIKESTYCSPTNKILIIMDNAECHMSIHGIEYANDNGIVIVTLPPHTTDKLQPLDVSVYASFKSCMRTIINSYTLMHPHKHITEHMLPEFASNAWIKACTPSNVLSGFSATGIWPINPDIFPDAAFLASEVTERPPPPAEDMDEGVGSIVDSLGTAGGPSHASPGPSSPGPSSPGPSASGPAAPGPSSPGPSAPSPSAPGPSSPATSAPAPSSPGPSAPAPSSPGPSAPGPSAPGPSAPDPSAPGSSSPDPSAPGPSIASPDPSAVPSLASPGPSLASPGEAPLDVTPESIRPFPKAPPRSAGRGRKRVRACILTENEEAITMLREKDEKRKKKEEKKTTTTRRGRPRQRKVVARDSSEEEEEDHATLELDDSSEYSDEVEDNDDQAPSPFQDRQAAVGDFVLVELELEEGRNAGAKVHYVAKVLSVSEESEEISVSYLRMSGKYGVCDTFYFPIIEDTGDVGRDKVLGVLCEPVKGRTQRLSNILKFPLPFHNFDMH